LLSLAVAVAAFAQTPLEDARRRESDLANAAASQERANAALREQLRRSVGPGTVQADLLSASSDAAALRKRQTELTLRRDVARQKLDQARDEAMANFDRSDEAQAAIRAASSAAAEVERLSAPILDRLSDNPDYRELQSLVDAAAQAGEALQMFPGTGRKAQAEADASFDEGLARLREYEEAATATDLQVAEARKTLRVAENTLQGLRQQYSKNLPNVIGVAAAQTNLSDEQRRLDETTADLARAEKKLSALRQANPGADLPENDLTRQLTEGETKLRDLNDQLDQARVARRDAEDRARVEEAAATARGPATDIPPTFEPDYGPYSGGYSGGGYGGYGYPAYPYPYEPAYVYYPTYRYYDPWYCPPYWSSGFFIGASFFYGSHHHHHEYDHYYAHRPYYYSYHRGRDTIVTYDYGRRWNNNWYHGNDNWHNGRYDFRPTAAETARDRATRSNLDFARQATADAEREHRFRTSLGYTGLSASARAREFEQQVRERRAAGTDPRSAAVSDGVRRSTGTTDLERERAGSDDARRREIGDSQRRREDEIRRARLADEARAGRIGGAEDSKARGAQSDDGNRARATADDAARRARAADENAQRAKEAAAVENATRARAEDARRRSRPDEAGSASSAARRQAEETARTRAAEDAAARARAADDAAKSRANSDAAARARAADDAARSRAASDAAARARADDAARARAADDAARSRAASDAAARARAADDARRSRGEDSGVSRSRSEPPPSRAPDSGRGSSGGGSSSRGGGSSSSSSSSSSGDSGGGRRR
jgi:hypothetical protein